MKRILFNLAAGLSLALCIGVCALWVRGRSVTDELEWSYDRYLPDRSAASTQVHVRSDRRLGLSVIDGQVGPYKGNVWGYYLRADQSGGRPKINYRHWRNDGTAWPMNIAPRDNLLVPMRWESHRRLKAKDGDDSWSIRIGVSHWVMALVLLVLPMLRLNRLRKERRGGKRGLCPACGYDLRATPNRCPECGRQVDIAQSDAVAHSTT